MTKQFLQRIGVGLAMDKKLYSGNFDMNQSGWLLFKEEDVEMPNGDIEKVEIGKFAETPEEVEKSTVFWDANYKCFNIHKLIDESIQDNIQP
jgi:hypothetical protein